MIKTFDFCYLTGKVKLLKIILIRMIYSIRIVFCGFEGVARFMAGSVKLPPIFALTTHSLASIFLLVASLRSQVNLEMNLKLSC